MEPIKPEDHLALVEMVLNRTRSWWQGYWEREEMRSIGYVALVKAANRFRGGRCKFSTYADHMVRWGILTHIRNQNRAKRKIGTKIDADWYLQQSRRVADKPKRECLDVVSILKGLLMNGAP